MRKTTNKSTRYKSASFIANRLSKIRPIDPQHSSVQELYPDDIGTPSMQAMIVLDCLKGIVGNRLAYSSSDIYYMLKYSTDVDERLVKSVSRVLSWRPADSVIGARQVLRELWECGMIRKFCKGFFSQTAGGRPYGVVWQLK